MDLFVVPTAPSQLSENCETYVPHVRGFDGRIRVGDPQKRLKATNLYSDVDPSNDRRCPSWTVSP
jgi:hypothetical protein